MHPHDRLWAELIFPRCEPHDLLALRAVCCAFRNQLDAAPARLWQPLIMAVSRMSYSERLLGWRGVEVAMERERVTRANCDAGRCEAGVSLDDAWLVLYVGGRIVEVESTLQLLDVEGELVASFNVELQMGGIHKEPIRDRWLLAETADERIVLLDCVGASLTTLAASNISVIFSVSDSHCAFRPEGGQDVTVLHVSASADGTTTVTRPVATVRLSSGENQFDLCERGRSYVLFAPVDRQFSLVDLATNRTKRVFAPRT